MTFFFFIWLLMQRYAGFLHLRPGKLQKKMRTGKYVLVIAAACMALLCSCSKLELAGVYDRVMVELDQSYTGIDVSDCIEVRYSVDCESAVIEADVNLIPYVEIYEKGNTLKIGLAKGLKLDDDGWNSLRVVVTLPFRPEVRSISLSGAATFISDFPVTGDRFSLDASGASRFTGDVAADMVAIDLSGASTMECGSLICSRMDLSAGGASSARLSGKVSSCRISLSGASTMKGVPDVLPFSLELHDCSGSLSGASYASFRSDGSISCSLSGASTIVYMGNADISRSRVSGDGSVIELVDDRSDY